MDDDDDAAFPWATTAIRRLNTGKGKGRHTLPDCGICWIWWLRHSCYTGFAVRDLSRGGDLCVVNFLQEVKAASRMRGRRSCTRLPVEDRELLKEELLHGGILMEVVGGTSLEDSCIGTTCKFRDVEHMLQLTCPWSVSDALRIEIDKAEATKLVRPGSTAVPSASDVVPTNPIGGGSSGSSGPGSGLGAVGRGTSPARAPPSAIQSLLSGIRRVLSQLHQQDALAELSLLTEALAAT